MAYANEDECMAVWLDPKKLASIAKRFEKLAKELRTMNCFVFGGSGHGTIRQHGDRPLILASCGEGFDGGCGACSPDEDGLLRGE